MSTYLSEVWVGVEPTLVAHCGAALGTGVEVWLVVGGCQIGGFAEGTHLAAGHWGDLGHRVGCCGRGAGRD